MWLSWPLKEWSPCLCWRATPTWAKHTGCLCRSLRFPQWVKHVAPQTLLSKLKPSQDWKYRIELNTPTMCYSNKLFDASLSNSNLVWSLCVRTETWAACSRRKTRWAAPTQTVASTGVSQRRRRSTRTSGRSSPSICFPTQTESNSRRYDSVWAATLLMMRRRCCTESPPPALPKRKWATARRLQLLLRTTAAREKPSPPTGVWSSGRMEWWRYMCVLCVGMRPEGNSVFIWQLVQWAAKVFKGIELLCGPINSTDRCEDTCPTAGAWTKQRLIKIWLN